MSTRNVIWVIVAIAAAAIMFTNLRMQFKSAKNEAKTQRINEVHATVTAPALERKTLNEEEIKESQKESVSDVAVYGVFYKKIEYSIIYTKHNDEINLENNMSGIISLFGDKGLKYKIIENNENKTGDSVRMSGDFEINSQRFGVEVLLKKMDVHLWQVVSVFPDSESNREFAAAYVDSVVFDTEIQDNYAAPEKK